MLRAPVALAAVIALGLTPAAATAQSDDATASVTVADAGDVTVVNTAGLSFGTHAAGTTVHSSNVPTAASWNLGFNADRNYAITFTLPSVLTSATGGTVPISFGNTSASSPAKRTANRIVAGLCRRASDSHRRRGRRGIGP